MRKWWAVFVAVAVVVVAVAGSGVAEAAKPGKDHPPSGQSSPSGDTETLQTIENILSNAQTDMANIANEFVANAPSAGSQSEFDSMQGAAEFRIDVTKKVAEVLLKAIRDAAESDVVFDAALAALQELQASRVAAVSLANSIEYSAPTTTTTTTSTTQPPPTTTTTSPTTTTTATSPTTTTTTTSPTTTTTTTSTIPGASSTTTVPGSSTTTSVPRTSSTTTTVPGSSTTTTIPGTSTTTTVAAAIVAPDSGSNGGDGGFAMAMPPEDAMFGAAADAPEPPSPVADLSGWVASMLDVVLPPTVVAVVLSPLIIIEVIGRTILRSGSAILLPIVLFSLTLLFFRWRDRKREAAHAIATEGPEAATA